MFFGALNPNLRFPHENFVTQHCRKCKKRWKFSFFGGFSLITRKLSTFRKKIIFSKWKIAENVKKYLFILTGMLLFQGQLASNYILDDQRTTFDKKKCIFIKILKIWNLFLFAVDKKEMSKFVELFHNFHLTIFLKLNRYMYNKYLKTTTLELSNTVKENQN